MLLEIKQKISALPIKIIASPKIYLNQSLYFDYTVSKEILAISYNQVDGKIYFYYRSKKSVNQFVEHLKDLGFLANKHQLVCDMQNKSIESIVSILSETLIRTEHILDRMVIADNMFDEDRLFVLQKYIRNINLLRCVDKELIKEITILFDHRFDSDKSYANFLRKSCDVGFLELVYATFEVIDKNSTLLEKFKKVEPSILRIQNFTNDPLIKELQIKGLSDGKNLEDTVYYKNKFLDYLKNITAENATPYNNMILNFILVSLLRNPHPSLKIQELIRAFQYFYSAKNMNPTRREVCLLMIIEYCARNNLSDFFKLPQKWYDHTGKVIEIITKNTILDEDSRSELWQLYQRQVRKANSFAISKKIKVAVCISGMYRNHAESLQSIKEKIVEPLDADVFIHTWDQMSVWSGCGGNPDMGRLLGSESINVLPKNYNTLDKLKELFPSAFPILYSPISRDIRADKEFSLLNPKKIITETEAEFLNFLGDLKGYMRLRNTTNQIKMFHGIKQSLDMALEYDNYDYIIRCRPDIILDNKFTSRVVESLENNIIYTKVAGIGLLDAFFLMSSSMAYNLSLFIDLMYQKKELSTFDNFPFYDSHNLLQAWVHSNNYDCSLLQIKETLLAAPKIEIPGLKTALYNDYSMLDKLNKEKFKDFVEYLIKRNG